MNRSNKNQLRRQNQALLATLLALGKAIGPGAAQSIFARCVMAPGAGWEREFRCCHLTT